jgi:hypothetical protein
MSTPRKAPPATASGTATPAAAAELQFPAHWVDETSAKSGTSKLRLPANGRVDTTLAESGTKIGIVGFPRPKRLKIGPGEQRDAGHIPARDGALGCASVTTWEVPMSTSVIGWFKPPLAEGRTIGLAEVRTGAAEAAIGLLTVAGFILFVVGTSSLFVLGAFYLKSLVTDPPFLGS